MKIRLLVLLSIFLTLNLEILASNGDDINELNNQNYKSSPFTLNLELSSRYIWRGQEYGDAPLGYATLSYSNHNFCFWGMGAYTFNNSHQEVDLGAVYTLGAITVGISDYYYPSASGSSDKYFDINNHTTGHWGEAYLTVCPFTKLPIWITGSCYIYGADKNPRGKQAYSSYAEIGYSYGFKDNNTISMVIGANLNRGFYTNYEKGFSIVNIDLGYSTSFNFGSFKLPVKGSYILNPSKEKSYFKFSAYFNL